MNQYSLVHWLSDLLPPLITHSLTHWLAPALTHFLALVLICSIADAITRSLVQRIADSLVHWFTDPLIGWPLYSPTHSLALVLTRLLAPHYQRLYLLNQ